jgi:hypothetical protein
MIETYGKFTALDGTVFPYTNFRGSRKEAAAKAEAHDKRTLAAREERKGGPLTIREFLEPATAEEAPPPSKPGEKAAEKKQPEGITFGRVVGELIFGGGLSGVASLTASRDSVVAASSCGEVALRSSITSSAIWPRQTGPLMKFMMKNSASSSRKR